MNTTDHSVVKPTLSFQIKQAGLKTLIWAIEGTTSLIVSTIRGLRWFFSRKSTANTVAVDENYFFDLACLETACQSGDIDTAQMIFENMRFPNADARRLVRRYLVASKLSIATRALQRATTSLNAASDDLLSNLLAARRAEIAATPPSGIWFHYGVQITDPMVIEWCNANHVAIEMGEVPSEVLEAVTGITLDAAYDQAIISCTDYANNNLDLNLTIDRDGSVKTKTTRKAPKLTVVKGGVEE